MTKVGSPSFLEDGSRERFVAKERRAKCETEDRGEGRGNGLEVGEEIES